MPKQDAFHRAGVQFKRRMVDAGNRYGKSTMGCAEDCAWLLGERSWYRSDDPARRGGLPQHPVKLLTITTDWDKVDEIWTSQRGQSGKVWTMLPRDGFVKSTKRNHSGAIDTIECANGSLWRFDTVKSFLANPQGSESSDWDAIHVDEPCPEGMFKAASRGLIDRGGSAWFTLTPLSEFWIYDYFFPQDGKARSDVWSVRATTYENTHLSTTAIDDYERTLTPEEKDCRLLGVPLRLAGLVYKDFSWDVHVLKTPPLGWQDFHLPPKGWPVYVAIDPHPRTPHAVLFCSVSPLGQRFYFYDMFVHCSIRDLVCGNGDLGIEGIRPFVESHGWHLIWTKVDPIAYIEDPVAERSMATEMALFGLYTEKATKALAHGILQVQAALRWRNPEGMPGVFFSPTARRTLWEIQRYSWDKDKNKPIDTDDHMMENLYRLELSSPLWIDPAATSTQSLSETEITRPELELGEITLTT